MQQRHLGGGYATMLSMVVRIDALVQRLVDIAAMLSKAARGVAIGFALAALVAVLVLRIEPPVGFGWSFPGWWITALALFAPAAIVLLWSFNAGKIVKAAQTWPHEIANATTSGVEATTEVLGAVKSTVSEKRGLGRLVRGMWGMRSVAGSVRSIAGDTVPVMAAMTPSSLIVTAAGILAGLAVVGIALLLALARLLT